ncbi:putative lipin [Schistosoma mansoni]|uniref:putative lipin n=1 Tax=Schistosoma mansoni TaxID=6183 RepID=UPI00022DBFAF|nr:putative lipin [Schistosoma mansoni]|eukprot:XP_018652360.1 putative lipin [Schistosoma mansoni]
MNYLGRLISSAHQYYKSINVANLTGAIDVIVVKNKDGEYQSTPFYVRFGKMGVLYPRSHVVDVCINGQPRPDICMHVEPTGYAYFDNEEAKLKTERTEALLRSNEELQTWTQNENDHIDCVTNESNTEQLENVFEIDIQDIPNGENSKPMNNSSEFQSESTDVIPTLDKGSLSSNIEEVDKENTEKITLRDLIQYLQDTYHWPNEFYIYRLLNKSNTVNHKENKDNPDNKTSQLNLNPSNQFNHSQKIQSTRPKFFRKKSSINCELLYPEDFLKLETDKISFNSIWIVWSDRCMSGETAARILLKNLSQTEKNIHLEKDTLHPAYNIILEQHKRDRGSEFPLMSSSFNETTDDCEPEIQTNQSNTMNTSSSSSWLWWRRRRQTNPSVISSDSGSHDLTYQDSLHQHSSVQSMLAPIDLVISSPVLMQEEFDQENYERPYNLPKTGLLNAPPTAKIPLHSSAIDVRCRSKTPDPSQTSSPEEAGYFSDDYESNNAYHRKTTGNIESRIPIQQANRLTSQQLKSLNLHEGANEAVFSVVSKYQGTCQCACFIYLWHWSDKIVISDIDGTITKSDWLGQLMPLVGMDWTHHHIAQLYNKIANNGYKFIYLSSRPIGQARATRKLLYTIQQGNYRLPDGPILLSPFSVLEAFRKEVIAKRADEYKIECLREVCNLFIDDNHNHQNENEEDNIPFIAGFGNRPTDIATYKAIGLNDHQIYTVDYLGNVICGDPGENGKDKKLKKKNDTAHVSSNQQLNNENKSTSSVTTTSETSSTTSDSFVNTTATTNTTTTTTNTNDTITTGLTTTTVYTNSVLAKLNLDSLLQMVDVYFPQVNDRLLYATNYSDYTYWRM